MSATEDIRERVRAAQREEYGTHTNRDQAQEDFTFFPLKADEQHRLEQVFVAPKKFPTTIGSSHERIFIVHGEANTGKLTTAVNLAKLIRENDPTAEALPIYTFLKGSRPVPILNELITSPAFKDNRIVIIKDALENGLRLSDLSRYNVPDNENLERKNGYIILTTRTLDLEQISTDFTVIENVFSKNELEEIFNRHLSYYFPEALKDDPLYKLLVGHGNREKIITSTESPKLLGIFFKRVIHEIPSTSEALDEILQRVARQDTGTIRRWFREMEFNPKLFAILIALLEHYLDIGVYDAEELYYSFVQRLRRDPGMDGEKIFIDPRRIGVDDLVAAAGLAQGIDGRLEFTNEFIRNNILKKEVPSYHGLLWVVEDLLLDQIFDPEQRIDLSDNEKSKGEALRLSFDNAPLVLSYLAGQIGIFRPRKLEKLLNALAKSPDGTVAALAAPILTPLTINPEYHPFIMDVLQRWVSPPECSDDAACLAEQVALPDYHWAATKVISSLYPRLRRIEEDAQESGRALAFHKTVEVVREQINLLGQKCGVYEAYTHQQEENYRNALKKTLDQLREEQEREEVISEAEHSELENWIKEQAADQLLSVTELNIIALLFMFREILQYYPVDVVEILKAWLENAVMDEHQDDVEVDINQLKAMLEEEHASPFISVDIADHQKEEQKRGEERRRSDITWWLGVVTSVYLFYLSMEQPRQETRPASPNGTAAPDRKEADNPETPSAESRQETGGTGETIEEVQKAVGEPSLRTDGTAESGRKPASNGQNQRLRGDDRVKNQIDIQTRFLPLLKLLPALLQASQKTITLESFLLNIPHGDTIIELLHRYRQSDGEEGIQSLLTSLLEETPIQVAMRAILRWYNIMGRDDQSRRRWVAEVYPILLQLINNASQDTRPTLWRVLFNEGWMDSPHADVRSMAHALLARAYILNGMVTDLPAGRHGVVMLDASWQSQAGVRGWQSYYSVAIQLLQRLSAMTCIHVYSLGATDRLATIGNFEETDSLTVKYLRRTRRHTRLLMPFFDPLDAPALEVDKTHFVLAFVPLNHVLRTEKEDVEISDLLDLLDLATESLVGADLSILNDPFATDEEKQAARQATTGGQWAWAGKLFLLATNGEQVTQELQQALRSLRAEGKPRNITAHPDQFFSVIDLSGNAITLADLDRIEAYLNMRVITGLHQASYESWMRDLAEVWERIFADSESAITFDMTRLDDIETRLNEWVGQLDQVEKARHPRDVTLTIAWTVLAISRRDLRKAIEIIIRWLESGETMTETMGMACTKILFNFYSQSDDLVDHYHNYTPLLELIAPYTRLGRGAQEYRPILRTLLAWARTTPWADYLVAGVDNDSPLLDSVRTMTRSQDAFLLRNLLATNELLLGLTELYIRLDQDWDTFVAQMERIEKWYRSQNPTQRHEKGADFARQLGNKMTANLLLKVENLLILLDKDLRIGMGLLLRILEPQMHYLSKIPLEQVQAAYSNVKRVADSMRLELYNQATSERLPRRTDGKRYGVILVDTSERGKELVNTAIGLMMNLQRRMKEEAIDNLVLTVHRIGRSEVVYTGGASIPKRKDLRPDGMPEFAPLLMPILDRYPLEDVAFALLMARNKPLDYDDWASDEDWQPRMVSYGPRAALWLSDYLPQEVVNFRIKENVINLTDTLIEMIGEK